MSQNPPNKLLLLQLAALLIVCLNSFAETGNDVRAKLQKEKQAMEQEQIVLSALQQRKNDLSSEQNEIKTELEKLAKRVAEVTKETQDLQLEQEELNLTIRDLEAEQGSRQDRYEQRLVAMYQLSHRAASLHYLIQSDSATDLLRRVHDLQFMVRYDQEGLLRLRNVITRLSKSRDEIAMLEQSKNDLNQELRTLEGNLAEREQQQAKVIEEVTLHEKKQEEVVLALRKSSAAIEKSLAQIMGSAEQVVAKGKANGLTGLAKLRGRIPYPVKGTILQGFGKQKHKEFSDVLLVKGVEFSVKAGGEIRAVAAGKVLFSDLLPGYGTMIIIDHGDRFYSLYGKLHKVTVEVGKEVSAGQVVASVSKQEPADGGGNFYFELREKGVAIDPQPYFSKSASF